MASEAWWSCNRDVVLGLKQQLAKCSLISAVETALSLLPSSTSSSTKFRPSAESGTLLLVTDCRCILGAPDLLNCCSQLGLERGLAIIFCSLLSSCPNSNLVQDFQGPPNIGSTLATRTPPQPSVIYVKYSPKHLLMCMIAHYTNDRMTDNYENVNHLVLNFYAEGYSIAVKLNEFPVFTSETILETAKIPYEETGLLDYIANEELPPLLVEMIDNSPKLSQYKIWRNGCLIIEVRDKIESTLLEESRNSKNNDNNNHNHFYKQSQIASKGSHYAQKNLAQTSHWFQSLGDHDNHHDSRQNGIDLGHELSRTLLEDVKPKKKGNYFVVLKPTNLSMLYDVLNLTSSKCWSTQQRLQLESQIVLHNSPILHLETDPSRLSPSPEPLCGDNGDLQRDCHWTPDGKSVVVSSGLCSNRSTKLNGDSHQRKLSLRTRLKSIYLNREIHVSQLKTNGNASTTNNHHYPKMNNIYHDPNKNGANGILPPELTLQQFLASKRSNKKKSQPIGQFPRFHRFLRGHK